MTGEYPPVAGGAGGGQEEGAEALEPPSQQEDSQWERLQRVQAEYSRALDETLGLPRDRRDALRDLFYLLPMRLQRDDLEALARDHSSEDAAADPR